MVSAAAATSAPPHRRGILNSELFSWLPRGASLINAARGGHLVEADLLAALESGQVRGGAGGGGGGRLDDETSLAAGGGELFQVS